MRNAGFEPMIDVDRQAPHGISCAGCGAPLDKADAFCTSCGLPGANPRPESASNSTAASRKWFQCLNCGSTVETDPHQRSFSCPFCDSNYVVEQDSARAGRRAPDLIIGFAVTPTAAQQKFRDWIGRNAWFRPGDLNRSILESKLVGVYLPFWCFSMLASSQWSAKIGEYWYRTETYTTKDAKGNTVTRTRTVCETEWWPLHGQHHQYYSGYLVSGSRGLSQGDADRVKPFQLPALQRYQPYFLAGWLCEEYSVKHDLALETCQSVYEGRERDSIGAFMPGDTHRSLAVTTNFSYMDSDLCLLPVYLWSYRYREKVYRFMVNGQTGKVAGDKPVSGTRISVLVVIVLVILATVFWGLHLMGTFR